MKKYLTRILAALGVAGLLTFGTAAAASAFTVTQVVSAVDYGSLLVTPSPVGDGTVLTQVGTGAVYTVTSVDPVTTPWGNVNVMTLSAPLPAGFNGSNVDFTTPHLP